MSQRAARDVNGAIEKCEDGWNELETTIQMWKGKEGRRFGWYSCNLEMLYVSSFMEKSKSGEDQNIYLL